MHAYLYTICVAECYVISFFLFFYSSLGRFLFSLSSTTVLLCRAFWALVVVVAAVAVVYGVFFMFMCEKACSQFQSHMLILCMCTSICYRCSVRQVFFFFFFFALFMWFDRLFQFSIPPQKQIRAYVFCIELVIVRSFVRSFGTL